jgi:H/ACA ribonucleoprotein complex non-core subunit NAF1
MRVTRYPTRAKQVASLAVLTGPNDSDVEDDEDVPAGSVIQYSGTKNEIMLPEVQSPELTQVPPDDVLEQMGEVMTIIDSVVVVRGHTSGFNRVLDTDSLLVFDDRKVLGLVSCIRTTYFYSALTR